MQTFICKNLITFFAPKISRCTLLACRAHIIRPMRNAAQDRKGFKCSKLGDENSAQRTIIARKRRAAAIAMDSGLLKMPGVRRNLLCTRGSLGGRLDRKMICRNLAAFSARRDRVFIR